LRIRAPEKMVIAWSFILSKNTTTRPIIEKDVSSANGKKSLGLLRGDEHRGGPQKAPFAAPVTIRKAEVHTLGFLPPSLMAPTPFKPELDLFSNPGREFRNILRELVTNKIELKSFSEDMWVRENPRQLHCLILDSVYIQDILS
jgi:hypothetical protein